MNQNHPTKREWLEAFLQGLEREGYTGEVMILAHFNRGELTKVRWLTEDKKALLAAEDTLLKK